MKNLLTALVGALVLTGTTYALGPDAAGMWDVNPPAATTPAQESKADKVDVSGAWAIQIDLGGNTGTPTVTFKQDGEKLTGTYSSQVIGEHELTGTVKGSAIEFGFTASFEGNAVKVSYTGTVEKDTMKGTVAFGDFGSGTFTGKKK